MIQLDYIHEYRKRIFAIRNEADFNEMALAAFHFQLAHNKVYGNFVRYLGIDPATVKSAAGIPCMPVSFFKDHTILTGEKLPSLKFETSGTTGQKSGVHYIADPALYTESFRKAFRLFLGDNREYCFLALLPSYLEKGNSSLIYMVNDLVEQSKYPQSGFYLHADEKLVSILLDNRQKNIPTILWGVTYALLDLAEKHPVSLEGIHIMETGGMKGRRKEMIREELHTVLKQAFNVPQIYSEYGMTELLSQAYCLHDDIFSCPPWMNVFIREADDPLAAAADGQTGGISVIDLANIHSCCFIATQDLGKKTSPTTFRVLGRFDNSDIRGCNLMIS